MQEESNTIERNCGKQQGMLTANDLLYGPWAETAEKYGDFGEHT